MLFQDGFVGGKAISDYLAERRNLCGCEIYTGADSHSRSLSTWATAVNCLQKWPLRDWIGPFAHYGGAR